MGRGSGSSLLNSKSKGRYAGIAPSRSTGKFTAVGELETKDGVRGEVKVGNQGTVNDDTSSEMGSVKSAGKFTGIGLSSEIMDKKVGEQGGSNPGGTYIGKDGEKRYVKHYNEPEQAYGEYVANTVYNKLGIKAPKSTLFTKDSETPQIGESIANDYIGGEQLNQHEKTPELANKILDGAAADILLANWDTIGLIDDNILIDEQGEPARIDNGGSLLYRAQDGHKPDSLLNGISEWDVFANDGSEGGASNESYANVIKAAGYNSLDDIMPRMKEQVEKISQLAKDTNDFSDLLPNTPDIPEETRDRILEMLRERKKLLEDKVDIKNTTSENTPPSDNLTKPENMVTMKDDKVEPIIKSEDTPNLS